MKRSKFAAFTTLRVLLATLGIAFFINVSASQAREFSIGNLSIDHPWARATAPAARTGVVYFSVKNLSGQADTLLSATVPSAISKRASLHEMVMDAKGLMRMGEIKAGVALAAKGEIKFAPGGYHVMLEGLVKPLAAKQEFAMTLRFAKAGAVSVMVLVE
jgi:copper(I)-binding protein